jgi:hypothetical protein
MSEHQIAAIKVKVYTASALLGFLAWLAVR